MITALSRSQLKITKQTWSTSKNLDTILTGIKEAIKKAFDYGRRVLVAPLISSYSESLKVRSLETTVAEGHKEISFHAILELPQEIRLYDKDFLEKQGFKYKNIVEDTLCAVAGSLVRELGSTPYAEIGLSAFLTPGRGNGDRITIYANITLD